MPDTEFNSAEPVRFFLCFALTLAVAPAIADPPPGYYATADTTSSTTLRQTVHEIIDDHTRFPYTANSRDTWDILKVADEDPNDSSRILDLYKNASYPKAEGGNSNYNREHSWPKSYGFPDDGAGNYPFTDCHHLFLADSGYNSSRGNNPYRNCDSSCTEKATDSNNDRGGGSGAFPGNSNWRRGSGSSGTWQTWVGRKGDVARALFYMDIRYEGGIHGVTNRTEPDLILTNDLSLVQSNSNNRAAAHMGLLSVLLEWHEQDPVDDLEQQHNDTVFAAQGNRNPFVDNPEWVACVFQGQCPEDAPTLSSLSERIEALEEAIEELRIQIQELSDEQ